ncbi:hypothetical protein LX32DRAFT_727453 [Colletotrichum zoysiae]|uniref:Uncharacterized protein n=1 Tax=Colletotrichum zoysiae TaxID=1216348 RepID=A0AAD9HJC7_9PEZI|nr:hypothetical protein LX32DRAFT_727453 [Colletotrichum zoysiae]
MKPDQSDHELLLISQLLFDSIPTVLVANLGTAGKSRRQTRRAAGQAGIRQQQGQEARARGLERRPSLFPVNRRSSRFQSTGYRW